MAALPPEECAGRARTAAALAILPVTGSVMLWQDEDSVAWLNVMAEPRDTGYHDHDGSAVGVYVIAGSVTNEGLPVAGPRRPRRYGPGDSFSVPGSGIHRMDHQAGAITVHVYSPPLRAIGYYEVIDGLLQRIPGPPDEASPESPRLLESLANR
jgi:hypothetical protein